MVLMPTLEGMSISGVNAFLPTRSLTNTLMVVSLETTEKRNMWCTGTHTFRHRHTHNLTQGCNLQGCLIESVRLSNTKAPVEALGMKDLKSQEFDGGWFGGLGIELCMIAASV